ncbi:MAG: acyl-ACP--UDP-N-acetylglucosamine O-acyltransferase [Deferribacteres bacterium]|nr:acyl-ACP--UDP-N-acetylglucosamine O-acyltransferase [candidate division KSB1 bacterium]MCB9511559.1 acyl-ACP--UDP-N-acetylglucosamine O-acyltransferase [Deferribacteres bacterium]
MAHIHQTAIVDPEAKLGSNVTIGPYAIVEKNTVIGDDTVIDSHALVAAGSRIGSKCKIAHGAVVGTVPQDLKFQGEETTISIGDRTTIREFATLNRGTVDHGTTTVGSDCLIMAYAHVAHDCVLGNHVILSNSVNLAGHVSIDDYAILGGMTPVHQFVHIGQHVFIGGGFRVSKDVPPYILAGNEPLRFTGLNSVGLRRRNFAADVIAKLKRTYRLLFRSGLNVSQALEQISQEPEIIPEVQSVIEFVKKSQRGIIG